MTRFDELRQARAMLLRLLDDAGRTGGKPLPPVQGVDELSPDDVSRLLVTCSTEVILRTVASNRQGAHDLDGFVGGRGAAAGRPVPQAVGHDGYTLSGLALNGAMAAPHRVWIPCPSVQWLLSGMCPLNQGKKANETRTPDCRPNRRKTESPACGQQSHRHHHANPEAK